MNKTTIPRARKKAPSAATQSNDESAELKARRFSSELSAEARSRLILAAMAAFREGDFSVRLPADWAETDGRIAVAFNQTIAQKERISEEVARLSETVGKEGRLRQRISLPAATGGWAEEGPTPSILSSTIWCGLRRKSHGPSARWPRATSGSRWSWR